MREIGKILYLCDGELEKCRMKSGCYKNGGDCMHTSNIEHAKNFKKVHRDAFIENLTAPENQTQDTLEEI